MPESKPPKRYEMFKQEFPELVNSYEQLSEATYKSGPLDAKSAALVKLGIAIGADMSGKSYVRKCLDAGLSKEEIRHAAILATTTIGFPNMMKALNIIDDELANHS